MVKIVIQTNDGEQRLDKFLKKYLKSAPLSYIYKLIRKNVKLNGKRVKIDTVLKEGDLLDLYISEDELNWYQKKTEDRRKAKRQFKIAYEDENLLIVEKPLGLLTHGDSTEKKNTLVNQVIDYLIEKGDYVPRIERTFVPAAVNRLDRNTTGLVIFGKNSSSVRSLNQMIREKGYISKYYLTIVCGELKKPLYLKDKMVKHGETNTVHVMKDGDTGKTMETVAKPIRWKNGYTLVEVELVTGRTHQIRAHLAAAGYPVVGDSKYGNPQRNRKIQERYGLTTQFLHAYRLEFTKGADPLGYMAGKVINAQLPVKLKEIQESLFER